MKKKIIIKLSHLFLVVLIFFSDISAQGISMPGLSPSMLSQMSDEQRRNLATQYGINLDTPIINNDNTTNNIGMAGEELTSDANQILYERVIKAQENTKKAEEYRKANTPIFEQEYSSTEDLPIYGDFLFDGGFSTFAPIDNAPIPNDYVIGVGDSLRILMYGIEDSQLNLVVNRDGSINFPELGEISIVGMTYLEASNHITSRVSKQMIGVDISISMGRLRSINIFMSGEAKIPGVYSVSGLSTISQLLYIAGGLSDIGSFRNIQVKRSNKIISNFDLYELLTEGNSINDIRLQSGDVIFIPTLQKRVFIDGAINRPGRYELKENETISDLVKIAGGYENRAYLRNIYIERYQSDIDVPLVINLDLTDPENLDFKIQDGDIIRIAKINDELTQSILVKGAINRPGRYGWYPGIRFSDIFKSINTDFLNNFDNKKGLIVRRENTNNYNIEVIDFDIKEALESPKSKMDPIFELYDEIFVFSLGYNDDALNDIEIYDPSEDFDHPRYRMQDEDEETEQSQEVTNSDPGIGFQMTSESLRIETYNIKKRSEYELKNRGKRRILLNEIIAKLNQQATSVDSVQIVSISGAVKVPGQYPLTKNASYMDLVELAGGFKDDAYIESAEVRQTLVRSSGAMVIETSDINLKELPDSLLSSRDHIHIRSVKDWNASDTVILSGEIFYPGSYLIGPNETLSSVIERAGGFTNESFVKGAIFTRESIKQKEREQLQILGDAIRRDQAARSMTKESEDFSVSSAEVEAGIEALLSSEVYGRLIIDIPRIIDGDSSADIVLQDGDHLTIPKFTNAVTVVGEVRRSGSFVRQNSYDIDDYLALAAGMTARGDSNEIYVIGADGSVRKNVKNTSLLKFEDDTIRNIQAGDTIVVPIKSSYQTPLNLYSTVSQVIFQSIASIAAFSTVFN